MVLACAPLSYRKSIECYLARHWYNKGMIENLSDFVLRNLSELALGNIRHRQHQNLHDDFGDGCQRILNAISTTSYITPHRHSLDRKLESLIAVRGLFAAFLFDDYGAVIQTELFGSEKYPGVAVGVELSPLVWHTVVALVEGAILFEVKSGPFDPTKAKEIATWAPSEGSDDSQAFVQSLGDRGRRCYENFQNRART